MNSGNSAAIYLTDGWRLMKIVSDTRPWKAARFIFPLKSLKEDAPELSSVRRISSDRPGHLFFKKKEKTILPGVGVSFVLEGVSERKKIFFWKRPQDFWEKFSSNSSSSDERHVQVTRCVQGISDFEFFCRPRTRFFLGGLTLIDLIPKRSGPNTSLLQRD